MNCSRVKRLLGRYIDDELDKQRADLLIEHLQGCLGCQKELTTLKLVKGAVGEKVVLSAGENFLENLKQKLPLETEAVEFKWLPQAGLLARRLIPVPVLSMLLLAILIFSRLNGLNPVDEYIFRNLNTEEVKILSGYTDNSDLLAQMFGSSS